MKTALRVLKVTASLFILAAMTACSGTKSSSVVEITQNDKHLSCTDMQLEITEAKFLADRAEKNRGASFKNILMPLSYPSTYMSADNAVEASNSRIEYLNRLYEVKGCNNQRQASADTGTGGYGAAAVSASGGYGAQF